MANNTKICKICGAEYEYCKSKAQQFRWQDVACCKEHADEYFRQIAISRGESAEEVIEPVVEHAVEPVAEVAEEQPEAEAVEEQLEAEVEVENTEANYGWDI